MRAINEQNNKNKQKRLRHIKRRVMVYLNCWRCEEGCSKRLLFVCRWRRWRMMPASVPSYRRRTEPTNTNANSSMHIRMTTRSSLIMHSNIYERGAQLCEHQSQRSGVTTSAERAWSVHVARQERSAQQSRAERWATILPLTLCSYALPTNNRQKALPSPTFPETVPYYVSK